MRSKSLGVFIFSVIFGIFLVGVVSADTNLALSANGGVASGTITSWNSGGFAGSPDSLNDGNEGTGIGFNLFSKCKSSYGGGYSAVVDLASPSTINQVTFTRTISNDRGTVSSSESVYLWYNGTWNQIYSSGGATVSGTPVIDGSWTGVTAVRVDISFWGKTVSGYKCWNQGVGFYEIAAYGTAGPVIPPTVCGDGTCDAGEDCVSCSADCGVCQACDDNHTIMKLYQENNSHGALWDFPNYDVRLCTLGEPPQNPHDCSAGNTNAVIWLYQQNNSHASTNRIPGSYDTPVCYGNLSCIPRIGNCSENETTLLSLYQKNNSHIAIGDFAPYPVKICCEYGLLSGDSIYWADMNGTPITTADLKDTVRMVYKWAGQIYPFEVWEDDFLENNSWFDDFVRNDTRTLINNGNLYSEWTITPEDFARGNSIEDFEFTSDSHEEFYFKVNGMTSGLLLVNQTTENDSAPSTQIIKPIAGTCYPIHEDTNKTKVIDYEQVSSDLDNGLNLRWDFGDDNNYTYFQDCTDPGANCNTTHQYSNSGIMRVELIATENNRSDPLSASDRVKVYVAKTGINVYSNISSPEDGYVAAQGQQMVQVNASSSFATNCSDTYDPALCTGPEDCFNCTDEITSLYCHNFPKSRTLVGYDLIFSWIFDNNPSDTKYGTWNNNYTDDSTSNISGVVEFSKFFGSSGEHYLNLKVGYQSL